MSEPSSLYARIRLSESAFTAFQGSVPALPSQYPDWLSWLATRHYTGTLSQADIDQMSYDGYDQNKVSSIGKIVDWWLGAPHYTVGQSRYNAETQTWTFGLLDSSENYKDFIVFLSILRGVARFKDLPGEDFILIFPFFWGGPPEAYVVVNAGNSSLATEVPAAIETEATEGVEEIFNTLQSTYSDQEV